MSDERDYGVQCPYYITDTKQTITCEGFIRGSSVIQRYNKIADRKQQMRIFCCKHYSCYSILWLCSSGKKVQGKRSNLC